MKHSAVKQTTSLSDHEAEILRIGELSITQLRHEWRKVMGGDAPAGLTKDLLARALAYRLQEDVFGGLSARAKKALRDHAKPTKAPRQVKAGSIIVREYRGILHEVLVVPDGFCWQGKTFGSLSVIAKEITGTNWNGPRFFGLRVKREPSAAPEEKDAPQCVLAHAPQLRGRGQRSSVKTAPRRQPDGKPKTAVAALHRRAESAASASAPSQPVL